MASIKTFVRRFLPAAWLLAAFPALAQTPIEGKATADAEAEYYQLITLPIPKETVLEVGGLATLPDGRLGVSTRRGEVWLVGNAYGDDGSVPHFKRFAHGLHEALGLAYRDDSFYLTQRGELTRLRDTNGDDRADDYETVYSWPLSGNYHEYSYGPVILPNRDMLVTLNLAWIGKGAALSKWRGWMLKITPDGQMTPVAPGMRSPAGVGVYTDGSIFYTENQGDWVGSGRMTHVETGDFVGNPAGLQWASLPGSPVKLRPGDIPDTGKPMFEVAKSVPGIKPPAVWFPQGILGISTSQFLPDTTGGAFGPFTGQVFVGDQGQSKIMRVFLEQVNGEYQGAAFPFREGFNSGLLRMVWGRDGSMFAGMTSRGWASTGKEPYGLQRLVWTGKVPFEIKTMKAQPDGFELEFTQPVDKAAAADAASYSLTGFTYQYRQAYGSPVIDSRRCPLRGIVVSEDGRKVRLVADSLREGYIHELKVEGVLNQKKAPLLHNVAYYTLNSLPAGEKLALSESQKVRTSHADHAAMASETATTKKGMALDSPPATKSTTGRATLAKRVTRLPADWTKGPEQTITVGTKPGLKFDRNQFTVKAGSRVKLVFNNNDDMLHNFVVTRPGAGTAVGDLAIKMGLDAPKANYVPNSNQVLFHTAALQPETSEAIYFTAPDQPGDYTYVCTLPGHAYVMQGTMRVTAK